MEQLGASKARIEAAVGPCIGQPAYQVGFDFEEEFLKRDPGSAQFFVRPRADSGARPHFDLPGYVAHRLSRAGLAPMRVCAVHICPGGAFLQLSAVAGPKRARLRAPNLCHRLDLASVFHNFEAFEPLCRTHAL